MFDIAVKNETELYDIPFLMFFIFNIFFSIFLLFNFNVKRVCYFLIVKGGVFLLLTPFVFWPIIKMGIIVPSDKQKHKIKTVVFPFIFYIIFTIISVGYCGKLLRDIKK